MADAGAAAVVGVTAALPAAVVGGAQSRLAHCNQTHGTRRVKFVVFSDTSRADVLKLLYNCISWRNFLTKYNMRFYTFFNIKRNKNS